MLRAVASHRGVQTAVALWVIGHRVVLWLARGSLPFDRPAVAHLSFASQMAVPTVGMIEIFVLMVLAFLLTRTRAIPDMAARAPDRRLAGRETILVLGYAALGQVGGWIVALALGYRPFSFHIAGVVFGHTMTPTPTEIWIWALYNFLVFAVAPYLYFRRRYTNTALNLHSSDRWNDTRLIFIVLMIESAFELSAFHDILGLSPRQLLLGAPLSFVIFFIGTVLPTFQYFGPGMMKSVLTLRTGNAWVHALGYHAVAPHVIVDTPLVVKVFGIV